MAPLAEPQALTEGRTYANPLRWFARGPADGYNTGTMSIYHLSVKTISRSEGRSVTAASAYRAGVEITDEQTGEVHDYRRKGGVEASALFVPEGSPDWSNDRAALWNAAERSEKRKNSTVGREIVVALPAELSAQDRQALAYDFARALVERHGVAVDACIHAPGKEGDERNHHCHILMTTRRMTPEGFGEKTREWDDRKQGAETVTHWRAEWARLANAALERAGRSERIDHRSHADRGIDRMPSTHMGPAVSDMLRKGKQSDVAERKAQELARIELARAEQAAAAADLAKVQAMLDQAQEAAAHELAEQRRQDKEQQRLLAMDSRQLLDEVRRMRERLPRVQDLAVEDPEYKAAMRHLYLVADLIGQAEDRQREAARAVVEWREAHRLLSWAHDNGLMPASSLMTLEGLAREAENQADALAPAMKSAQRRLERQRKLSESAVLARLAPHQESINAWYSRALQLQQRERQAERQERQQQRQGQDKDRPEQPPRQRDRGYSR